MEKPTKNYQEHEEYMRIALEEAKIAFSKEEVPIGAIVVKDGIIISKAHNQVEEKGSTLYHAEIIAIKRACKHLNNKYLNGAILYVTVEPCTMCSGAIMNSRISKVVYGADEEKTGTAGSVLNLLQFPGFTEFVHIVPNVLKEESAEIMKKFFSGLRSSN